MLLEVVKERFRWSIAVLAQKEPARPVTLLSGRSAARLKSTELEQAAGWEWLKLLPRRRC